MQVSCIVEETIIEGQIDAFVDYMSDMVRLTKAEAGCIAYDLYESIDGSGEVVLVEIWKDKEALDTHMQTDHFKKYVPGSDVFKAKPTKARIFSKL